MWKEILSEKEIKKFPRKLFINIIGSMVMQAFIIAIFFCLNNMRHRSSWKRMRNVLVTPTEIPIIHWAFMREKSTYSSILFLWESDIKFLFKDPLQFGSAQWFINFLLIHLFNVICVYVCLHICPHCICNMILRILWRFSIILRTSEKMSQVMFFDM